MGIFRSRSEAPLHEPLHKSESTESLTRHKIEEESPPSTSQNKAYSRDRIFLVFAIAVWYIIGVGAIVTTKILLTDWKVPPVLLTVQQLTLASSLLRLVLTLQGRFVPLPVHPKTGNYRAIWEDYGDFLLAGLFNALDFLSSNTGFSHAAASFVETIKTSDPLFTTAVALAWKIDFVTALEAVALALLMGGIMLTTWGNQQHSSTDTADQVTTTQLLTGSFIVIMANICFAFRCMFQKRYRASNVALQVDDANLLCRFQQVGATALLPVTLVYGPYLLRTLGTTSSSHIQQYLLLSLLNCCCYASYNWASTYCLTKLSVLRYSSLGCLRRLFAIVATCLFFGVPLTWIGAFGLLVSISGFLAFSYLRHERTQASASAAASSATTTSTDPPATLPEKDSVV